MPTPGQCVPHSGFLADQGPNPAKNQASENTAAGTLIWPPQLAPDTAQLRLPPRPKGSPPALLLCSPAPEPALGEEHLWLSLGTDSAWLPGTTGRSVWHFQSPPGGAPLR